MKKIIITVFATSLISTTAFAAPAHKRAHQHERQHHSSTHAQIRSNHKLHRDLLGLALFVGAAVAIDAAIDNHHDREKRPARPYRPDAVGPTRHHDHYQANRQASRHSDRHSKGRTNHNYDGRGQNHHASNKIDDRQQNQRRRIRQGVESGALAKGEAKRLRQEQRHIAQLEADFRADGRLNRKESAILLAKLKTSSDRIYNKKHNDRYRR